MNKTKLKYIKYTKKELDRYVRDKNSCINLVNSEMHIGFPPWGFVNFQETLTNIISREKIGKFDPNTNGIVLDVRNIQVLGTNYPVHDDDPINHINIKANFYVFQPIIGAIIKGIVKHISHGHVAVIIYRVFNVSIRFSRAQQHQRLRINDTISFRIKKFDLNDAMPYIEGELIAGSAETKVKHKIFIDDDENLENGADSGVSTGEASDKQANGAKKNQLTDTSSEDESESSDDSDSSGLDEKPPNDILLGKIQIKQEKFSDSDTETIRNKKAKVVANERNNDSDSETSSTESDESDKKPTRIPNVKKEKATSPSSTSSSESDSSGSDDSSSVPFNKKIKKENANDTQLLTSPKIKLEPMSDVENGSTSSNLKNSSEMHRKKTLSIREHLNSFEAEVGATETNLKANRKSKKIRHSTILDGSNWSDLSFQSPAVMSSTKLSNSNMHYKKKQKTKSPEDPAEKYLENIELEIFKSFTG